MTATTEAKKGSMPVFRAESANAGKLVQVPFHKENDGQALKELRAVYATRAGLNKDTMDWRPSYEIKGAISILIHEEFVRLGLK